jgi:RNA recognition motif-containing protein
MEALDDTKCFIRNVPFDVDEERLAKLFGEVGPVRKTIVLRGKSSDIHKGVAFVSFSLKQDASRAASELNGCLLEGRKLHVRFHLHRHLICNSVLQRFCTAQPRLG